MAEDDASDPGGDTPRQALSEKARQALHREFSNVLAAVIGSLNVLARRHTDDAVTQAMVANALYSCNDLNLVIDKIIRATNTPT